ncbi:radical SAM protein [Anaerococcus sp. AGMB09787]|uniref:radical SAM/SPASM domain-containing protein n=1 Tax=Anaerococcus sp. AGMB09787 TaxID=2922869 RepID=UPI001FAFA86E|nr:radical SAM protein [Anaerococcus sp. AGMB09787]
MKILTDDFTRNYKVINQNGNVVFSSESEILLSNINRYYEYASSIDSLSVVYYNLTKRCDFNCTYCYSIHDNSTVSMEDNYVILRKLKELNAKNITLIGGEPFYNANFHSILESCIECDFFDKIYVVTNGSLIDDSKMHLYCNNRVVFQISIDGIDEYTNSKTRGKNHFEVVYNNIKKLVKNGANVVVMKVLTRDNIEDSKEFYSFYKKQNINVVFFMVKQVVDSCKPNIHQLKELLDFVYNTENGDLIKTFQIVNFADNMMFHSLGFPIMHCGAGINALSIMPNGDVYPCVKKEKDGNCITNLLSDTAISEIKSNRQRIIANDMVDKKDICSECDIAYYCGGGCRAEESECKQICLYNCDYFHFAKEYFIEKVLKKYSDTVIKCNDKDE